MGEDIMQRYQPALQKKKKNINTMQIKSFLSICSLRGTFTLFSSNEGSIQ